MTEREKAMQDINDTMRTYAEVAKMHDINFAAFWDISDKELSSAQYVDGGAAIDFPVKMVMELPPSGQDYFTRYLTSKINEQRGIVEPPAKPRRKFSILWGLVSFG